MSSVVQDHGKRPSVTIACTHISRQKPLTSSLLADGALLDMLQDEESVRLPAVVDQKRLVGLFQLILQCALADHAVLNERQDPCPQHDIMGSLFYS